MAVNKTIAQVILRNLYNGFFFDRNLGRYKLKLMHVTENELRSMQQDALALGEIIKREDINLFLSYTKKDCILFNPLSNVLSFSSILYGEVLKLKIQCNDTIDYIEFIKMTDREVLFVNSSKCRKDMPHYGKIAETCFIGVGTVISLPPLGSIKVLSVEMVSPMSYYYYTDSFFMPNLHKFEVNSNLWYCYEQTRNFIEGTIDRNTFENLLLIYQENGLSTYNFRMILNSFESNGI